MLSPKILAYLFAAGVAGFLALATVDSYYDKGYAAGYRDASNVYDERFKRMQNANNRAILAARESYSKQVKELAQKAEKLEDELSRLNAAALEDPDANSGGITPSSVQRLNAIR